MPARALVHTAVPAAHWDESDQWPKYACMSRDAYGARGTINAAAGDSVSATVYMNADHSGLYRYELACGAGSNVDSVAGNEQLNSMFNAAPFRPFLLKRVNFFAKDVAAGTQDPVDGIPKFCPEFFNDGGWIGLRDGWLDRFH